MAESLNFITQIFVMIIQIARPIWILILYKSDNLVLDSEEYVDYYSTGQSLEDLNAYEAMVTLLLMFSSLRS